MTTRAFPNLDEIHQVVAERLATAGQRYTDGRRELVSALAVAEHPLAMPQLLARTEAMPVSSAYRHLTVLASCDVVRRLATNDEGGAFELTDELSGHHHHHLVCSSCGAIKDIAASPALEQSLVQAAELAAKDTGYSIDAHHIELVGICASCQ